MKLSVKAVLVVATTMSLANLAQAQSGITNRQHQDSRARRGLNQSSDGKKRVAPQQLSATQATSSGGERTSQSKSIPHIDLAVISVQQNNNSLRVRVMNVGRSAAPATQLKLYARDRDTGRVVIDRKLPVRALEPNQAVNMVSRTGTLNNVNVYATIDADYKVIEPNERNNVGTLSIGNQTEYTIDLKIQEIRFDRDKKEVWVAVRNVGPVALDGAASVSLRSYFGAGNRVESHLRRVRRINTGQPEC